MKYFSNLICIEFTANVESDLDKIVEGTFDYYQVLRKIYDVFHPIVIQQMSSKRVTKDAVYIGDYEIKTGKYGPYVSHQGINKGLSPYIDSLQKKLEEFTVEDIEMILRKEGRKEIGKHNGQMIYLIDGPYNKYIRYGTRNIKIPQKQDYTLKECIEFIQ